VKDSAYKPGFFFLFSKVAPSAAAKALDPLKALPAFAADAVSRVFIDLRRFAMGAARPPDTEGESRSHCTDRRQQHRPEQDEDYVIIHWRQNCLTDSQPIFDESRAQAFKKESGNTAGRFIS
jgi:hypothetical protein